MTQLGRCDFGLSAGGCADLNFANDLTGLREVLAELEPTKAALARAFLPKNDPDMGDPALTGLVGSFHVDNRRWDVIAQDEYVDPEALPQAA